MSSKPKKIKQEESDIEIEAKRPVGRPSLYKPEYCLALIEHFRQGFSYESFAGFLGVHFDTLYEWERVHHDFSETKRHASFIRLYANEKTLLDITNGRIDGNITGAIFMLKNAFPHLYRDRREVELTNPKNMTKEELIKEAESLIAASKGN